MAEGDFVTCWFYSIQIADDLRDPRPCRSRLPDDEQDGRHHKRSHCSHGCEISSQNIVCLNVAFKHLSSFVLYCFDAFANTYVPSECDDVIRRARVSINRRQQVCRPERTLAGGV